MADLMQMLIEFMRIDCGVVECYYTNQIDAIFNLFFFPTVFILLVIYLLLNYILDEVRGGLRLLIAVALYAVVVLNGLMTLFIPLSKFWWIVLILVVGAWIFFTRLLFRDRGGGGHGALAGAAAGGVAGYMSGKVARKLTERGKDDIKDIENDLKMLRGLVNKMGGEDTGRLSAEYINLRRAVNANIENLQDTGRMAGFKVERKTVKRLVHELGEINDVFEKKRVNYSR